MTPIQAANNDLAAELVLNKIMNNQLKSSSGRTITAGNRMMASELSQTGYELGANAATVEAGKGIVLAAQATASEMLVKLQQIQKMATGTTGIGNATRMQQVGADIKEIFAEITALDAATVLVNGDNLTTAKSINAGMGLDISILGKTMSAGTKMKAASGLFGTKLKNETALTAGLTAIQSAIDEMNGKVADFSIQYNQLRDRATVLNDLNTGFANAANAQSLNDAAGSNGLLNSILGTSSS